MVFGMVELNQEKGEEQEEDGVGNANIRAIEKDREDQVGKGGGTLILTVIIIEVGMEFIQAVNLKCVIGTLVFLWE